MTIPERRPRIGFFSYSSGAFDSRTRRTARSAMAAGYEVTIYARLEDGLPAEEVVEGIRILRVPNDWRQALPGRRRAAAARPRPEHPPASGPGHPRRRGRVRAVLHGLASLPGLRLVADAFRQAMLFPIRPHAWAVALDQVVEPADVWHGMWAGSLPALARFRGRFGGSSIYDSRDIYVHARSFDRAPRPVRALFRRLERHWARRVDAVITVNDAYARLLRETLGVEVAAVVRNTPERFEPPSPRPDLIRERLGLAASTRVVLYQGNLMTERGIEEGMDAILQVPEAVLVLLGYGALRGELADAADRAPYRGRVHLVDAVPPSELLAWTASADVLLMAIQPTTLNHRFTTPNKLWEALAAGAPVVAGDLPGMAEVVAETGAGVLCDPTDPASIAAAIRSLLELPADELEAYRRRGLAAAHDRYNWETQVAPLLGLYASLTASSRERRPAANASETISGS